MKTIAAALMGVMAVSAASHALAQDQSSGGRAPAGQASEGNESPTLKPEQEELKPASIPALDGLADLTHKLYTQHAILIKAVLNDDFQGNITGGVERGSANGGGYSLGLDWGLGPDLGDPGGQIHLGVTQFYGKGLNHIVGNAIKTQGWYYSYEHFNLSQVAYEQNFFGNRLNFYGGRVNATTPFAKPTYGCNFMSGSMCPYYLPLTTGGLSSWPYVTWGGRLRYTPTDKLYAQVGSYEVNPQRKTEEGFNLSLNHATGYIIPVEVGYGSDFGNDRYPRHYKLGGWFNSAPYTDPLLNTKGLPKVLDGGTAMTYTSGRGGVYALADQVVYRPNDGTKRNLAVFASVSGPLDDEEIFQSQNTAGFYWTGPMASRPHDTVGVQLTYIVFTGRETEYMNDILAKAGSKTFINRDQLNIEANYGYQIVRGLVFHPDFEYIINPDISARLGAKTAPKDVAILGFRISVDLDEILGLPSSISMPRVGFGPPAAYK